MLTNVSPDPRIMIEESHRVAPSQEPTVF